MVLPKNRKISINELLNLIPESHLSAIAAETGVDYQVSKLKGNKLFKLLMYSLLSQKELSTRILETLFSSLKFQHYASLPEGERSDHSSLATRLSTIKVEYFKRIYESLNEGVMALFTPKKIGGYQLIRFDSTLVSIAGSLLSGSSQINGLQHGTNASCRTESSLVDIKFSIGFNGISGVQASFFDEQSYLSEEIALKEVIEAYSFKSDELAVFDRGLNKRDTLDEFTDNSITFVTRLKTQRNTVKHKWVKDITPIDPAEPLRTETLIIEADQEVYLYSRQSRHSKHAYRLIRARSIAEDEKKGPTYYYFLTNEKDLSVEQILLIYQRRWDIEVFFKYLKQEFGFNHLISRNKNGIEVMLYMTLITFLLVFLYFKINQIESFKIAKLKFFNQLEEEIFVMIVQHCQGDPQLLNRKKPIEDNSS